MSPEQPGKGITKRESFKFLSGAAAVVGLMSLTGCETPDHELSQEEKEKKYKRILEIERPRAEHNVKLLSALVNKKYGSKIIDEATLAKLTGLEETNDSEELRIYEVSRDLSEILAKIYEAYRKLGYGEKETEAEIQKILGISENANNTTPGSRGGSGGYIHHFYRGIGRGGSFGG